MTIKILVGDCRERMAAMDAESVDAICTDPPAGISFMGKEWDGNKGGRDQWIAWLTGVLQEAYRVAKPGAHAVVWALPRTSGWTHRALEDAGWEVRDCITHLFGSGFPKSKNLARQWDGWGTALKPAAEFWYLARKPLTTSSTNVLEMVELGLRNQGFTGEIRWTKQPVERAAKRKRDRNSSLSSGTRMDLASVEYVSEQATPLTASDTVNASVSKLVSGRPTTESVRVSTAGTPTDDCGPKSSRPTVDGVVAAASANQTFSPSITSTAAEPPIESLSTEKFTANSDAKDSPVDTESFAGIATGLTGSLAHVRISRNAEGLFLWPHDLPEFVPSRSLTVAANVAAHGTGAINIDGCRIGLHPHLDAAQSAKRSGGKGNQIYGGNSFNDSVTIHNGGWNNSLGRWPANVVLDEAAAALLDEQTGIRTGGFVRNRTKGARPFNNDGRPTEFETVAKIDEPDGGASRFFPNVKPDDQDNWTQDSEADIISTWENEDRNQNEQMDSMSLGRDTSGDLSTESCDLLTSGHGSKLTDPSRPDTTFITSTKTNKTTTSTTLNCDPRSTINACIPDANSETACGGNLAQSAGSSILSTSITGISASKDGRSTDDADLAISTKSLPINSGEELRFRYTAKASRSERSAGLDSPSNHPTVKPLSLMQWLVRLVTPPGGTVLDPFCGSGTTGIAADREGFNFIGIELSEEYARIAEKRIRGDAPLFADVDVS